MPGVTETLASYIDYGYKVELPDGTVTEHKGKYDENDTSEKEFVGRKAGISGNISTVKSETKISDKYDAKVGAAGPSLGASLGYKMGSEVSASAIVEPTLAKIDGNVGPAYGSVGLNGTTGLKYNQEGIKVGIFGFGVTLGIGGKYTVDTPVGSVGATRTQAQNDTNATQKEENVGAK